MNKQTRKPQEAIEDRIDAWARRLSGGTSSISPVRRVRFTGWDDCDRTVRSSKLTMISSHTRSQAPPVIRSLVGRRVSTLGEAYTAESGTCWNVDGGPVDLTPPVISSWPSSWALKPVTYSICTRGSFIYAFRRRPFLSPGSTERSAIVVPEAPSLADQTAIDRVLQKGKSRRT